jgi:hypothetical protein
MLSLRALLFAVFGAAGVSFTGFVAPDRAEATHFVFGKRTPVVAASSSSSLAPYSL